MLYVFLSVCLSLLLVLRCLFFMFESSTHGGCDHGHVWWSWTRVLLRDSPVTTCYHHLSPHAMSLIHSTFC